MKWINLTRNLCPKCNKKLGFNILEEMIFCNDLTCGFQISQYRMERLVAQMNGRKMFENKIDNFSMLQNMGHEEHKEEEPPEWL